MKTGITFGITALISIVMYLSIRVSLSRNRDLRRFVCERWWLHPNWICVWRVPMGWFGLWLYFGQDGYFWGILIFTIAAVLDGVDGLVARACELVTEFGKEFDPLCDKFTYLPALGVFAYRGDLSSQLVIALFAIELFGQFLSRPLLKWIGLSVAANKIGKIKVVFIFALIIYQATVDGGIKMNGGHLLSYYWLWACILLALGSIILKFVPKRVNT